MTTHKTDTIARACELLATNSRESAIAHINDNYPFVPRPVQTKSKSISKDVFLRVFVRDGFIDRFFPENRLIFPPVLQLLSRELGEAFPCHPNWKMDSTHPAYWDLWPSLDHVIPRSRGGSNDEENLVTVAWSTNVAKTNSELTQLNWTLGPKGNFEDWDGCLNWFVHTLHARPDYQQPAPMRSWYLAAQRVLAERARSSD